MPISRREFVTLVSSAAAALGSRTLHAQAVKVRREIRTLSAADIDTLKAGIGAMQTLPKANFRSWLYQAGVHGAPAADSVGVPDAATYWNQCVHSGLHFLSWHRWELLFIEEIIRLMSDRCAFTLPYWDYIANGFLPDPLRIPADAGNPLFDSTRTAALNNGTGSLAGLNTGALSQIPFNDFSSILYGNPHSAVHGQISGNMGGVPTAARDPVFYLHHCNIDRYWECWIKLGAGRANPGSPWTEQTFPFHSISGRRNAVVGDCVRTADLGYTYDNLPCGRIVRPEILEILKNLRFFPVRIRPPRPIPDPWPWRALAAFDGFAIDGRPIAVVLPRKAFATPEVRGVADNTHSRTALVLQDVEIPQEARNSGFFIEVWLAPSVKNLRKRNAEGAEPIGSFSAFDISEHRNADRAAGHAAGSTVTLELPQTAQRALLSGRDDAAVVFVRRGLVDKAGAPLPFDEKAEWARVGALRIEVAR